MQPPLLASDPSTTFPSETVFQLTLPRDNVASALQKLSEQTGYAVVYSPKDVDGYQSHALFGYFDTQQALDFLLADTPLTGVYQPGIGIRVFFDTAKFARLQAEAKPVESPNETKFIAQNNNELEAEVISVRGQIDRANADTLNKRYSDFIIDSVHAGALGQLPGQDIANALQRIPGVSIERRDEQGVFATVRGFGPEFNTVLYNGRVIATENQGREFSFDVLSPEIITSADVYKSSSTDVLSGSIGSTINLRIPKPMQHPGYRSYTNIGGHFNKLSQNWSPQFATLISYANQNFGALITLNYQNIDYRTDSAHTDGWFNTDLSYVKNQAGEGDFSQVWVPRNFDLRTDEGNKSRIGGSIVLESQINDVLKATLDLLYSRYKIDSNIRSNANWTHIYSSSQIEDYQTIDAAIVDENNTLLQYRYDPRGNYATDFVQLNRSRPTQTSQIGLNLLWDIEQNWAVELDISHSSAANKNGGNRKFIIAGAPNANPLYKYVPGEAYPRLKFQRPVDVTELRSHGTIYSGNDIEDAINQLRLDAEYLIDKGVFDSLYFGTYISERQKSNIGYRSPWGWEFAGYEFDIPDELFTPIDTGDFLSGHVPKTWYAFDAEDYVGFLWSDENIQQNVIGSGHWLEDSIWIRKAAGGVAPIEYPSNSWRVKESIQEAYVKLSLSGDYLTRPWELNAGIRYANTQVNSEGYEQAITNIESIQSDPTNLSLTLSDPIDIAKYHSYSHWLAAINFKYNLTDSQVLRVALYDTISRPSLSSLIPSIGNYNARVGASTAVAGNPYLMPYEAANLDLSWAWYFSGGSYLSANYFYKNLANFVSDEANIETLFDHPEGDYIVLRPVNGDSIKVSGIEVSVAARLDFIADWDWLTNTELQARYTFVDGRNSSAAVSSETDLLIEGLSDSFNIVASHQYNQFKGVLSYTFRDEYLRNAKADMGQPEMVEAYRQLDFSLSWIADDQLEYYFEGSNLLNAKQRTFSIYKERLLNYEDTGVSYTLGVRLGF
ncbi:TonB-dependent receptor [Gayadomonas joobiniege]|uniref:TonB-dependent receptor n=1 Tax=Gayadomonas joobiniege TaxID=1234606 RepID=UPI00138AEFE8|nr:TonB-dependent receptor [Gayadomonas joobiniege]